MYGRFHPCRKDAHARAIHRRALRFDQGKAPTAYQVHVRELGHRRVHLELAFEICLKDVRKPV
jgi:hypothetical protein